MRRRQQGMSVLEFTLVVVLFSTFAAVLLNAIAGLRADVERAAVRQILNQMDSALAIRFSELYIRGDEAAIAAWEGANALALVRGDERSEPVTGDSALGQSVVGRDRKTDSAAARDQPTENSQSHGLGGPGEWSFEDGVIIYRPAFPEALAGRVEAVGRWEVVLCGDAENPRGLRLRTIEPLIGYGNNHTGGC